MSSFENALGALKAIPQWFLWRLEPKADGKYEKTPCALDGTVFRVDASKPENWRDYEQVRFAWESLPRGQYAMGFWLTRECGVWFLDLDNAAGSDFAAQLVACYPGAFVEWSSSGKGLHVIARHTGRVPEHRTRPTREVAAQLGGLGLEFYTQDRGIAFGLSDEASGSADVVFDVAPLVDAYFKREVLDASLVRGEWRGPADDDVLIERMLNARQSAASAFGAKASLRDLWTGNCELNSEHDMALASHLAFWTGCDEPRIERLMRRSALVREKWNESRPGGTYLTYTIANACAGTTNVYQEPVRDIAKVQQELYGSEAKVTHAGGEVISREMFAKVDGFVARIASAGSEYDLHNIIAMEVREAGIPMAQQERVVQEFMRRLQLFGNKMPIGKVRAMLFPPVSRAVDGEMPDWAKHYCFVLNGDKFFNLVNGSSMSMVGFQAAFGRLMPMTEGGRRANAAEHCLHFWGMPVVEQVGYRPDCGEFYEWDGVRYANRYTPGSLPEVATTYSEDGLKGIEQFQLLLWDMCGRRQDVYGQLLLWYAHNVQHPGVKIRWAPIMKGINGDGKTLAVTVLRAAMGHRNVTVTGNATLTNSGGFTDWMAGGAVNVIEEIMLVGKVRHQLYNSMKEAITNNVINVNPKGATGYSTWNCTNHYANTNHNDALPLEKTDRRWFVIFTPWEDREGMMSFCGLDAEGWRARTDAIDKAIKNCAGELRAWLLSIAIPADFDINGDAMWTPEKRRMMASSTDDAESVAQELTAGKKIVSSSILSTQLSIRAQLDNFDVPRGIALNHMLTRLGFSKYEKQVKWNGRSHTIWMRNGVNFTNDEIRSELEG